VQPNTEGPDQGNRKRAKGGQPMNLKAFGKKLLKVQEGGEQTKSLFLTGAGKEEPNPWRVHTQEKNLSESGLYKKKNPRHLTEGRLE